MADSVQLTDLDVITRYSIAVRTASADRDELIETLRADLTWLERGQRRTTPAVVAEAEAEADGEYEAEDFYEEDATVPEPARAPLRRMPVKVTPAPARKAAARAPVRKAAAKKTAAKKTAAKKTATRRSTR